MLLLNGFFSATRLSHISLTLVGLMWIFPFLHYRHEYPLTTFDQEWWAVLFGLLAMFALPSKAYWQAAAVPRIVQLPVALIVIAIAQIVLGKIAYFEQGLLYILYLLFAVLMMMLGAWLRRSLGLEKLVLALAFVLLAGTEINALLGVLQHFGWHTPLDSVIVRKVSVSLYGNVAQPNHYANYLSLGLISLGLLLQQKKIHPVYAALLALPVLFSMTLSGSRSSWLYLICATALAAVFARKNRALLATLYFMFALLGGFALMHVLVQLPLFVGAGEETNTINRLVNSDTNGSVRLYLWHEACLIFMQSPWLGSGFGQFAVEHLAWLPKLQATYISSLYNNAHNVIFQLAAETGLAGLLSLFASGFVWIYGLRRVKIHSAAHWWGYAALCVLTLHSLLEYPLWYAYFMAIFALLLGMMDETEYRLELRNAGRVSLTLLLMLGLAVMLQLQTSYQQLKTTLSIQAVNGVTQATAQRTFEGLAALHGNSLLSPYADLFISSYTEISPQDIAAKLAFNTQAMRYIPTNDVVYRQALLLAQDGQLEAAKKVFEQAIWSYPGNGAAHQLLAALAQKDPAHFSALLEFATQKEQEHASAVRIR